MGDSKNRNMCMDTTADDLRKLIEETAEALAPELKKLALDIHDNPELGHQEFKACGWQADLLRKYGFEVEVGFEGIPTAYKAVYRGKAGGQTGGQNEAAGGQNEASGAGPKLAMLAEYDALPELGHGCGHNLIAMISVGAGLVIRRLVDKLGGEIHVIGTPAEETAGAKVEMARKGAFREYDAVMMAHPMDENFTSMDTLAMYCRSFEFFGKTAHAAAAPYEGCNALDAVINFFNLVNALRQQTKSDARIHGIITNGGAAPNVIPDYTSALFYIRAEKVAYVEELLKKITACAEAAALGTGTTVKISKAEEDFKDTCSNLYLANLACSQMEKLGVTIPNPGRTVISGSSDLGDVSYQCPAIQLCCGMGLDEGEAKYGPHTIEFVRHACSEQALDNAMHFVKGFAMTAAELLTNPDHLTAIRKEFEAIRQI
ncbi:MAG: M20 family metallopeptidase [Anaerovoracaceae bacterium]